MTVGDRAAVMNTFVDIQATGKAFFLPPAVAKDKVKFIRDTFDRIGARDDFQKEVEQKYGYWDPPMTGETLQEIFKVATEKREMFKKHEELVRKYSAMVGKK